MMFYKPLVSFVVAIAAASSVAASATPVAARGATPVARGDYPPPSPSPTNECGSGNTYCCDTWTNANNPILALIGLLIPLNIDLIQGVLCELGGSCNTQLCCNNDDEDEDGDLFALNCVSIL